MLKKKVQYQRRSERFSRKMLNKEMRDTKGITLIALIVTIIVLLILAGITIHQLTQNGLLKNTENAKEKSELSSACELLNLKIMEANLANIEKEGRMCNLRELEAYLGDEGETEIEIVQYNKVAYRKDTIEDMPLELKNIVVKLVQYKKYTFLIGEKCTIERYSTDGNNYKQIEDDNKISKSIYKTDLENLINVDNIQIELQDILKNDVINKQILENNAIKEKYNLTGDKETDIEKIIESKEKIEDILKTANIEEISLNQMLESKEFVNKIVKSEKTINYIIDSENIIEEIKKSIIAKDIMKTEVPLLSKYLYERNANYTYLYFHGDECIENGGQWKISDYGESEHGNFDKEDNHLLLTGGFCYSDNFCINKENLLDLTKYSSLNANIEFLGLNADHECRNANMSLRTKDGVNTQYKLCIRWGGPDDNKGIEKIEINLDNLTNNETYITFDSNSYIVKIHEVWLEE